MIKCRKCGKYVKNLQEHYDTKHRDNWKKARLKKTCDRCEFFPYTTHKCDKCKRFKGVFFY